MEPQGSYTLATKVTECHGKDWVNVLLRFSQQVFLLLGIFYVVLDHICMYAVSLSHRSITW